MKNIEKYLNILHFCFYKADYKLHLLSNKINPFHLIHKLPFQKRRYESLGIEPIEHINKIWGNKRYGFSIILSSGGLVIALFLIILAVFDILNCIFQYPVKSSEIPFLLCALLAYTICHYTVFKGDKYLKYFRQFEKWSKADKWKYGLLTFAFVAGSIIFWLYSFRFLPKL